MKLRFFGDVFALEHLLHQIDSAARTVEFVAEQLIGRASREAKSAVNAGAKNGIRFFTFGRLFERIENRDIHKSKIIHAARIQNTVRIERGFDAAM